MIIQNYYPDLSLVIMQVWHSDPNLSRDMQVKRSYRTYPNLSWVIPIYETYNGISRVQDRYPDLPRVSLFQMFGSWNAKELTLQRSCVQSSRALNLGLKRPT